MYVDLECARGLIYILFVSDAKSSIQFRGTEPAFYLLSSYETLQRSMDIMYRSSKVEVF